MIFGIVDVIKIIYMKVFKTSKNRIKNPDEAEFIIRNIANQHIWDNNCNKLVRIDNFDNETEKIINIAQNDFDFLDFKLKRDQI